MLLKKCKVGQRINIPTTKNNGEIKSKLNNCFDHFVPATVLYDGKDHTYKEGWVLVGFDKWDNGIVSCWNPQNASCGLPFGHRVFKGWNCVRWMPPDCNVDLIKDNSILPMLGFATIAILVSSSKTNIGKKSNEA
jgi:hypothetical protein